MYVWMDDSYNKQNDHVGAAASPPGGPPWRSLEQVREQAELFLEETDARD